MPGRQALFTTPEHNPDLAAELVASALVREASASTAHRRLVLGCHLGVKPEQVLGALAEKFAPDALVTITEGRAPVTLQAVPLPGDQPGNRRLLVPYLVGDVGPNAGSSRLRGAAPGSRHLGAWYARAAHS